MRLIPAMKEAVNRLTDKPEELLRNTTFVDRRVRDAGLSVETEDKKLQIVNIKEIRAIVTENLKLGD